MSSCPTNKMGKLENKTKKTTSTYLYILVHFNHVTVTCRQKMFCSHINVVQGDFIFIYVS